MKLLHLADLHIGVETYGRIDATSGLHSRLLDYLERLDEAITFGLNEGVDLVLIAGDIYKSRNPTPTHQREFAKRIGQLRAEGVPVFILTGNHDITTSAGRASSVEIFSTLQVEGVTIADRPATHRLETRAGPVQIIALPWVTRHVLLTRDDLRLASFSEIEALLRQRIEQFVIASAEQLDPTIPSILAMHGTIDGSQTGAERGITLGQDLVLPRSVAAQPAVDYVALGHIHRHQSLGEHPPVVYAGSIERVDFGERGEDKGCVLVELEKGAVCWRFHRLAARPFVSIEVDVRTSSDPQQRIASAVKKHHLDQAVVRVEVKIAQEQVPLVQESHIREQVKEAGAFVVAAIVFDVQRESRRRYAAAEQELMNGLTLRRALEIYLQSKNTDTDRLAALLQAADELLAMEG